jgi:fructosamine-3-kinase
MIALLNHPIEPMATDLAPLLCARLGGDWTMRGLAPASAFCATWRAEPRRGAGGALFVKSLPAARADVLEAEADGLEALAAVGAIRVPAVAACWIDDANAMALLAIEWLDFAPASDPRFGERFGRCLAALHAAAPREGEGRFGWRRDNWIGGTAQRNRWSVSGGLAGWLGFFGAERLRAMTDRLAAAGAPAVLRPAIEGLIAAMPSLFDDGHVPRPSLIHGDLWSGNWGRLADGTPVIFDPAVSVSDAEAELAMMELFGAPPAGFWPAYREAFGLAPGYARRRGLYQLYHLLNHALLFGGGYLPQSMATIERLLARPA